jgi:hypothetical protein
MGNSADFSKTAGQVQILGAKSRLLFGADLSGIRPASRLASSTVQGARKKKFLGVALIAVRPVFRLRHG